MKQWKRMLYSVGIVGAMLFSGQPVSASAETVIQVPVCTDITIPDADASIYVHIPEHEAAAISVCKTEPEGMFQYYNAMLSGSAEQVYQMRINHCEYLPEQETYTGNYTIMFTHFLDDAATGTVTFIVGDPDFTEQKDSAIHFYVNPKRTSKKSSGSIQQRSAELDGETWTEIYDVKLNYTGYIQGDIDGNNMVDIQDASAILSWYAEHAAQLSEKPLSGDGDVNRDDMIDITDASCVLQYYAKHSAGMHVTWEEIV